MVRRIVPPLRTILLNASKIIMASFEISRQMQLYTESYIGMQHYNIADDTCKLWLNIF